MYCITKNVSLVFTVKTKRFVLVCWKGVFLKKCHVPNLMFGGISNKLRKENVCGSSFNIVENHVMCHKNSNLDCEVLKLKLSV